MVHQLFPDKKLERIPMTHELFSAGIGFPIQRVKRRIPQSGNPNDPLDSTFKEGEPFLEGIEVNGRYCVIYSKYDLSCAWNGRPPSPAPATIMPTRSASPST